MDRAVEKLENGLGGGTLISMKSGESSEQIENGKGSPDHITVDVLKALLPGCLEKLAIVVCGVRRSGCAL